MFEQKTGGAEENIWVDEIGDEKVSLSLSSGVSGKVLFYLELFLATKDNTYLNEAIHGCKYIASHLPVNVNEAQSVRNSTSLYGDISGSAFVLMEAYKITKDEQWKYSVDHCLMLLDSLSMKSDGRYWNAFNDILVGSAGTGMLLLYLHKETGEDRPLQLALEAAKVLEQRAIRESDSLYWYINQDNEINLPNFSHGAAGIGYFFASLYDETGDENYLNQALEVAKYLDLIAWKPDDSFLLPYGFPDYGWEREFDIGWAHGPAGTARFFYKLWQITKDDKWLKIIRECANGINYSGLPETPNDKFGSTSFPVDMRFGLGGVVDFYISLSRHEILEPDDIYLERLITSLDEQSMIQENVKRYWQIERYGFIGGDKGAPATFTGYFYGAAGLGLLYIKLHNLKTQSNEVINIPDDPF